MAKPELLSNLTNVKGWLNLTGTTVSDTLLTGVLQRTSSLVLGYLERSSLVRRAYTDVVDGQNNYNQFTENWPILSVSSVGVWGNSIPASLNNGGTSDAGYSYESWNGIPPGNPQQIELCGYTFSRGQLNVTISYQAGYAILAEPQTVSSDLITVDQPFGIWTPDTLSTVAYASTGVTLTQVASAPQVGQYALNPSVVGGYMFNAADNNTPMLIGYSYVPGALEQAILDMINETVQRRNRPGLKSHNLATMESGSFETAQGIPAWAMTALQPYKSVLPL